MEQALGHVDADTAAGLWLSPDYDAIDVCAQAESLSRRHTAILGTRSLDILHVAAAVVFGALTFVTNDERQAGLAKVAGLRVVTLAGGRKRA